MPSELHVPEHRLLMSDMRQAVPSGTTSVLLLGSLQLPALHVSPMTLQSLEVSPPHSRPSSALAGRPSDDSDMQTIAPLESGRQTPSHSSALDPGSQGALTSS